MNITRSNWNQLLPFIKQTLEKADLVAIDFEMTGIQASGLLKNSIQDTMQVRYWKNKENVKRFLPLQIGICGFQIKDSKTIEAYPFNIYLYPFTGNDSLDKTFFVEGGAVQFLAQHNFDFNRTFYDGVFYLSKETEKIMNETQHMNDLKENLRKQSRSIDPDMLAFVSLYLNKIIQFFASDQQSLDIEIKFIKVRNYKYLLEHVEKVANLQKYHVVYDNEIFFKRQKLTIIKGEGEIAKQLQQPVDVDPIGVRQLIDQLIWQKTPILMHNGFTDLSQLYDKFLFSLPEQYEEFRQDIHQAFPVIYDTKYMIKSSPLLLNHVKQLSALRNSYDSMKQFKDREPHIKINEDFGEYQLHPESNTIKSKEHEAGYDALMTGYLFFKSAALLKNGKGATKEPFVLDHEKLKFYRNKLPLGSMRSPFNLEESDDKADQKTQIFYLSYVQRGMIKESRIKEYFNINNMGEINLFQSQGQCFEYFMVFTEQSQGDEYIKLMNDGSTIIEVDGRHIVVSVYENYQEQLKRKVKDQYVMKNMWNCLDSQMKN